MVLLRHLLGDALRRLRLRQGRTLREVSAAARVSLGYLSEVERGQKEASSELLAAICGALETPLSQIFREVSDNFALAELQSEPVLSGTREPSLRSAGDRSLPDSVVSSFGGAVPAGLKLATGPELGEGAQMGDGAEPVISTIKLPAGHKSGFDDVARRIRDITDMVPV
jgi:transcriptional regulator with XRE-family HTH domain